jgi:hypothetical protein
MSRDYLELTLVLRSEALRLSHLPSFPLSIRERSFCLYRFFPRKGWSRLQNGWNRAWLWAPSTCWQVGLVWLNWSSWMGIGWVVVWLGFRWRSGCERGWLIRSGESRYAGVCREHGGLSLKCVSKFPGDVRVRWSTWRLTIPRRGSGWDWIIFWVGWCGRRALVYRLVLIELSICLKRLDYWSIN